METPTGLAIIHDGFALLSRRVDAVSERSDRAIETLNNKLLELIVSVANIGADQKIVLQQVRLTNGTVTRHDERLVQIETNALTHDADCPLAKRVEEVERKQEAAATKRGLWYAQGKAVWGALLVCIGAFMGAWASKVIFK